MTAASTRGQRTGVPVDAAKVPRRGTSAMAAQRARERAAGRAWLLPGEPPLELEPPV